MGITSLLKTTTSMESPLDASTGESEITTSQRLSDNPIPHEFWGDDWINHCCLECVESIESKFVLCLLGSVCLRRSFRCRININFARRT